MSVSPLLDRCHSLDIHLWADAGRLRYDALPGALSQALRAELVARKAEVLEALEATRWEALAALRWGSDPSPGIVIDRPDRGRMLVALEEAARNPDRYAIEEREAIQAEPSTFPDLIGPCRTRWGTVVYSAPDAEPIEAFGPIPL